MLKKNSLASIYINSKLISIAIGVRQGCFSGFDGVTQENKVVPAFTYTNDLIVFAQFEEQLQRRVLNVFIVEKRMNLLINVNQSKIMLFKRCELHTKY